MPSWTSRRKPLAKEGKDPFGDRASAEIGKKELDEVLANGEFDGSRCGARRHRRFRSGPSIHHPQLPEGEERRDTERIVIGGGLREHRVGELAIGRAAIC